MLVELLWRPRRITKGKTSTTIDVVSARKLSGVEDVLNKIRFSVNMNRWLSMKSFTLGSFDT